MSQHPSLLLFKIQFNIIASSHAQMSSVYVNGLQLCMYFSFLSCILHAQCMTLSWFLIRIHIWEWSAFFSNSTVMFLSCTWIAVYWCNEIMSRRLTKLRNVCCHLHNTYKVFSGRNENIWQQSICFESSVCNGSWVYYNTHY